MREMLKRTLAARHIRERPPRDRRPDETPITASHWTKAVSDLFRLLGMLGVPVAVILILWWAAERTAFLNDFHNWLGE